MGFNSAFKGLIRVILSVNLAERNPFLLTNFLTYQITVTPRQFFPT